MPGNVNVGEPWGFSPLGIGDSRDAEEISGSSLVMLLVKNTSASAEDIRDVGSIPGSGGFPGGGHSNPLHYSCLENLMDRGTSWATVPRGTKSHMTEQLSTQAYKDLRADHPVSLVSESQGSLDCSITCLQWGLEKESSPLQSPDHLFIGPPESLISLSRLLLLGNKSIASPSLLLFFFP